MSLRLWVRTRQNTASPPPLAGALRRLVLALCHLLHPLFVSARPNLPLELSLPLISVSDPLVRRHFRKYPQRRSSHGLCFDGLHSPPKDMSLGQARQV